MADLGSPDAVADLQPVRGLVIELPRGSGEPAENARRMLLTSSLSPWTQSEA